MIIELEDGRRLEVEDGLSQAEIGQVLSRVLQPEGRDGEEPNPAISVNDAKSRLNALDGGSRSVEFQEGLSPIDKAIQGFNVGVAKGAGSLVDLVNGALSVFGLDVENPVGGSRFNQQQLAGVGAAPQPGQERQQLGKVGRITEEIGAVSVPAGAVNVAARAAKFNPADDPGSLIRPVLDFFQKSPGKANAAELTAATGAGIGATIGLQIDPDGPYGELAGQLIGGLASSPTILAEVSPKVIANVRRSARVLFTDAGAKDIASQIVQKSVSDQKQTIEKLKAPSDASPGSELTVGKEVGDPGLLALERSLLSKSEELGDGISQSFAKTNKAIQDDLSSVRGGGTIASARVAFQDKINYLQVLSEQRIKQAVISANNKTSKLSPNTPRERTNEIVRKEIEDAYDAARAQETELWNAIPGSTKTSVDGTRGVIADILKGRDRVVDDPKDLPQDILSLFRGKRALRGQQPVSRLLTLRKRVLAAMRNERGQDVPNRRKIGILNKIQGALLDDISTVGGQEVDLARAFSADLNQRFTQGTVGDFLDFQRTGESSVPASLTLETSAGKAGPAGAVALDDINRATGTQTSPKDQSFSNVQDAVRDFIADRFLRKFPDGKVGVKAGKRFLSENKEVLERNPVLKAEIEEAVKSQANAERIIQGQKNLNKVLADKNQTAATVFLDAPVDKEISRIFLSKNPQRNMQQLVKLASRDKSGEALAGLKAGVIDEVFKAGTKRGGRDINQLEVFDGDAASKFIRQNKRAISSSGVLSPDEINRLQRAVNTAIKNQRVADPDFAGEKILDESPDAFTDLILSVVGANIGGASAAGQASGAPLVLAGRTASAARNVGQKWISKIPAGKIRAVLNEAIRNRELMLELQKRPKTVEAAIQNIRALRGFLFNIVPESFEEPIQIEIDTEE